VEGGTNFWRTTKKKKREGRVMGNSVGGRKKLFSSDPETREKKRKGGVWTEADGDL